MQPSERIAIVMVGLPARGKTFTANKLVRYLRWLGVRVELFNVGLSRRATYGAKVPVDFFDASNPQGSAARWNAARQTMDRMLAWFAHGPGVAIYDATNSTSERRHWAHDTCAAHDVRTVFLELDCTDPDAIERNIRSNKVNLPDYEGLSEDDAVADFKARIAHYERAWEPLQHDNLAWLRIVNSGEHVELHRLATWLPGHLLSFLTSLHTSPRPIWLSRHGESEYNIVQRIGGDPPLTERGRAYARRLAAFVDEHHPPEAPLSVWTSRLRRTAQTAEPLYRPVQRFRHLDEISGGLYEELSYAEIAERYPDEYAARKADKLGYRYPRGESYLDLIERLAPMVAELERTQNPVLVIAHQAVLRAIYAYFTGALQSEVPHLSIPLHTVIRLAPQSYTCSEERFSLDD